MDKIKKELEETPNDDGLEILNQQVESFKNKRNVTNSLRQQIIKWKNSAVPDSVKLKLVDEIRKLQEDLSLKTSKKTEIETTITIKRTNYEGLCSDDMHKVKTQTAEFVEKQQRSLDELEKDISKLSTKLDVLVKQHSEYLQQQRLIKELEKEQSCAESQLQYIEAYLKDQKKQFEKMLKSKVEAQKFSLSWTANVQAIEAKLQILSNSNIPVLSSELPKSSTDPVAINIVSSNKKRETGDGGVKRKAEMITDSGKVGVKILVTNNKNQAHSSSSSPSKTSFVGSSPPKIARQDGKKSRRNSSEKSDRSQRGEKKSSRTERRSSGSRHSNRSRESRSKNKGAIPSSSSSLDKTSNRKSSGSNNNSKTRLFESPLTEGKCGPAEKEIVVNQLTAVLENILKQTDGELAIRLLDFLMFLQDPEPTTNNNTQNIVIHNEISQHFIYNIIQHSPSEKDNNHSDGDDLSKRFIGALSLLNRFKFLNKKVKVFLDDEENDQDEGIIEELILIRLNPEIEKHLFPNLLSKNRIKMSFTHLVFSCREEITRLKSLYKHEKKKLVLNLLWNILRKFHWIPASHLNDDDQHSDARSSMTSQEYLLLNNRHYLAEEFNDIGYYSRAHDLLKENYELLTNKFHIENSQNRLKNKTLLSSVLKSMGRYSESLSLASEVYHLRIHECGLTGIGTMEALNNISCILLAQGNFTEAHTKLKFSLNTQQQQLGEEDEGSINANHNLACLYLERGGKQDLEEAYRIFVKIHEIIFKKSRSSNNNTLDSKTDEGFTDDLLWVKSCLGEVYCAQGNGEAAMKSLIQVYIRNFDLHGKDHPSTLESLRNVARANSCLGNLVEALDILNDVLNMQTVIMGKDNPETLCTLYEKSCLLVKQKEFQQALDIFQQVFESQVTLFGSEHYKTVKTQENIKATQELLLRHENM